jgi:hypothetical protein
VGVAAVQTNGGSLYGRRRGGRVLSLLLGMFVAFLIGGPAGLAVFSSVAVFAAVIIYWRRQPSSHV